MHAEERRREAERLNDTGNKRTGNKRTGNKRKGDWVPADKNNSGDGYGWRVVVPATSANLGCAFDCGGLAMKLYLKALFAPGGGNGLTVSYQG